LLACMSLSHNLALSSAQQECMRKWAVSCCSSQPDTLQSVLPAM
jgi:hypothetical protein